MSYVSNLNQNLLLAITHLLRWRCGGELKKDERLARPSCELLAQSVQFDGVFLTRLTEEGAFLIDDFRVKLDEGRGRFA
jgi:hypothetical protein